MLQAHTATAKVMTNLTCWKCGEETLKEMVEAVDPQAFRSVKAAASGLLQSECTKCGTHSVNATQARYNKVLGRKNRKAVIKEANRKSS